MKSNLLLVSSLFFLVFNLKAQDPTNNIELTTFENDLGPHIHLHERGYYFVTEEFMNPTNDRSSKPSLDSVILTSINTNGDTTSVTTQILTISEENRITSLNIKSYTPGISENKLLTKTEYFFENDGPDLIQYDTLYNYLENGPLEYNTNRVLNINSDGIITSIISQQYVNGSWENYSQVVFELNEFGCLNSRFEYRWSGSDYYPTLSYINTCEDELLINELFTIYYSQGTVENPLRWTEFEYDENDLLITETVHRPNLETPGEFDLNFVRLYSYDQENRNDTIIADYWDEDFEEFYTNSITTFIFDELNNIQESRTYRYSDFNNLYLSSNIVRLFDNNYLAGDFLSGSVNRDLSSMLLRNTVYSEGDVVSDNQYFYSTVSVSSTEQTSNINFEVYPNPTSGELNIKFTELVATNSNIVVRNSTGAVVMSQIADGVNNLNVGHLPSGMYFISVEGSDLRSEVKKFIKM